MKGREPRQWEARLEKERAVGHLPGGDQRERAVVGSTRAAQGKWRIQMYLEESGWPCRWVGWGCGRQGSRMTHRSVS